MSRGWSGRFDEGAAARTHAGGSGWLLACPHELDVGRREGFLVKSAVALVTAWSSAAPWVRLETVQKVCTRPGLTLPTPTDRWHGGFLTARTRSLPEAKTDT